MGHTRVKGLPCTRQSLQVEALLGAGAGVAQIATATLAAAERGFNLAADDPTLIETVHLLMQMVLVTKSNTDVVAALRHAGLDVPANPRPMDVVAAFTETIDARLANARRSDLGEMAQMAAAETLSTTMAAQPAGLFSSTADDVRNALGSLGTVNKFGEFAGHFFTRLTTRVLDCYLSRAFAQHVGPGRRFSTLAQQAAFDRGLALHCKEATRIIERFSGEWFSQEQWLGQGQIPRERARDYAFGAFQKLVSELKAASRNGMTSAPVGGLAHV